MQCVTRYLARAAELEVLAAQTGSVATRDEYLLTAIGWRNLALQARIMAATEASTGQEHDPDDDIRIAELEREERNITDATLAA